MFVCLTASCVVRFGDRTSYRYRKQAFTLHLMFSCSLVLIKTCSYVFKKTCSYVLMSSKKHVLLFSCLSKKNMFFCPPTALNFYQVAHNRIAHKEAFSCQSQVVVVQLDSAVV